METHKFIKDQNSNPFYFCNFLISGSKVLMAPHIINKERILQVKVSNSRQQMVGHLLKDIVESSEKPNLTCSSDPKFDRFGFKIDADGSLEEKAERLRRVAQENWEEAGAELSLEEVESRWVGVVTTLRKPAQFTVTLDIKKLIRGGIPINQRGVVWKAIVDNRWAKWRRYVQSCKRSIGFHNHGEGFY